MDELLAMEADLGKEVYDQVADLLNLEVDLLFFDTTSTYFETGGGRRTGLPATRRAAAPPPTAMAAAADEAGFRTHGKSKDSRPDLPQVIVGMAVTRDGIPVRVWCWPGQHRRLRADPPGQGRHARVDAGPRRLGRRPRASPPRRTAAT